MSGLFNRSGTDRTIALDTFKACSRVGQGGLLHRMEFYGVSCQGFGLVFSPLCNRRFWVILQRNPSQKCLEGFILHSALFLLCTNIPDDFTYNIAICANDTTLYKHYQTSDLWQRLDLAFDLQDGVN